MRFCPNEPPDHNKGQRVVWNLLKQGFDGDDGVAYYRYPVFSGRGSERREPDFLIVSRKFGVWVFECKGAQLNNIAEIQGQEWVMRGWYSERMCPVQQAEDQLFEVKALVERDRDLRSLGIVFDYRVVLPFVSQAEWQNSGFADHPSAKGVVLVSDDLEREPLKKELRAHGLAHMPALTDEQWERLKGVFRGDITDREPRSVPAAAPPESPIRTIHAVESRLRQLDEAQERVAQEAPEGPQRIRGLAGTGKTVLFAKRAARLLAAHPEWNIAFVFFTRSLYQQIRGLLDQCYRDLTSEPLDEKRLFIWHAWGGKDLTGFYREASLNWDERPLILNDAVRQLGKARAYGPDGFEWVCDQLEAAIAGREVEPFLDAVLVDEGQDLPPSFYRLALRALREPHRLYWAYDEAQGIGNLMVPRAADIFGVDEVGHPNVDLSGSYPSGIQKAHNLNRCYRTPAAILTVAHGFNMGLRRTGGPLQGVTTQHDWSLLGYEVEGDFSQVSVAAGREVVLRRDPNACGHPYDDPAFNPSVRRDNSLELVAASDEDEITSILVTRIRADIEQGLEPHDILVVVLAETRPNPARITAALNEAGVSALEAGADASRAVFRSTGSVTVASIFRAKGNEGWKVYAVGLHAADPERCDGASAELIKRNQVFVALTRARTWCVGVGLKGPAMDELQDLSSTPEIRFRAFNQRSLQRSVAHDDGSQAELELRR